MSDQIAVRGGPGGTAAWLDDLDLLGARLDASARAVAAISVRVLRIATDPLFAGRMLISPRTALEAESRLARALGPPAGLGVIAARLAGLASGARGVVVLYRAADLAADAGLKAVDLAVGQAAAGLVPLTVAAAATQPVAMAAGAAGLWAVRDDLGPVLLREMSAHTGAVEHAVDALPGAVGALTRLDPALAAVLVPATGMATVPPTVPGASRWLGRLGSRGPWLRETGTVTVTGRRSVPAAAPTGAADLVRGVATLDPDRGARRGTVRVVGVTGAGGRRAWVVEIPGTQNWSPRAGRDPFDLTGNIHGMAGSPTAGRQLVEKALSSAGVRQGEPVLLAGHSQGGLVAAELAADARFRASYQVTHVVTFGAPVGSVPLPDSVKVLSLEHDEDIVPRLDGSPNPDRPEWVTVSRPTAAPGRPPDPSIAHGLTAYSATADAVDRSTDPGLVAWRDGLQPFLAAPGVTATGLEVTGVRGPGGSPRP